MVEYLTMWCDADVDGNLLGFINPSLTLFSDNEAVTSCDVTSEMTLTDDDVDVTPLDGAELRIKAEPMEMYDSCASDNTSTAAMTMTAAQSGTHSRVMLMQPTPTRTIAVRPGTASRKDP